MPRQTAERAILHPLTDDAELLLILDLFPDLAPKALARIAVRQAGYERNVGGPLLHCPACLREVPTVAISHNGIPRWLCLREYHVLTVIADLTPFGVRVDQLPAWAATAATGTPEPQPMKGNSHE